MNIIGIIPARYASTRFPGKPLHLIADKPLVQHVVERCREATSLTEVIVATDDERLAEGARGFGYDPLFVPEGHTQSFAELGPCIKNSLSHRARAMEKVVAWLRLAG